MNSLDVTGLPADKIDYLRTLIRNWENKAASSMENSQTEIAIRMRRARNAMPPLDVSIKSLIEHGREH